VTPYAKLTHFARGLYFDLYVRRHLLNGNLLEFVGPGVPV
jgi:hypothetical protein